MRFLIDARLSNKLSEILSGLEIQSVHVIDLPKGDETPDFEVGEYADTNNLIVLTKGYDFVHSHFSVRRCPKGLIHVDTGNIKNRQLFDLFRTYSEQLIHLANLEAQYWRIGRLVKITKEGITIEA